VSRVMTEAQFEAHRRMFGRDQPKPQPEQKTLPGTTAVSFIIPLPPSVNALYGVGSDGQKFLLPDQKTFRNDVIGILHISKRGREPLSGRLELWMRLHFANKRRSDIDNRIKSALDAMSHAGAFMDDSQIDKLIVERVVDPDAPEFCSVVIREIA
jgi:crossover junction endodeoxyribonuclease RusA